MSKQVINVGTVANDGTGDPLRTAFTKSRDNDNEVYALLGGDTLTAAGARTSLNVDVAGTAATAVATHEGAADPHTGYQKEIEKNAANGYAGLDASSKLTGAQQVYGSAVNTAAQGNDARLSDARTPLAHAASHQDGGSDEISVTGLSGLLADAQKVTVRKNTGADVGTRQRLNLIEGANVTLTVADDVAAGEIDITIASATGSHTHTLADITDEGALAAKNTVATADIDNDAVTNVKLANMASGTVKARGTAATGDPEDLAVNSPLTISASGLDFNETVTLDNNARVTVRKNTGADVGTRRRINLIEGTNVTLTVADASITEEVNVTIAAAGGGGSTPTGTGFRHVTVGVEDAAAKLVDTADVNNDQINNTKLADMVQATLKGRAAGAGTGDPTDLTAAQGLALLGAFSGVTLQVFTTAGANTYTPTVGMKSCIVFSTGGGAGGGGADTDGTSGSVGVGGGGGAAGTCIEAFTAAQIGASQTVTIGAGGTGGSTAGGAGVGGGATTFGALHTAATGSGGGGSGTSTFDAFNVTGGAGGIPTGGTFNLTGGMGTSGVAGGVDGTTDLSFGKGGNGGGSFWGSGGQGSAQANTTLTTDQTAAGIAGVVPGSGGGGAVCLNSTVGVAGGNGASGVCLVIEFT